MTDHPRRAPALLALIVVLVLVAALTTAEISGSPRADAVTTGTGASGSVFAGGALVERAAPSYRRCVKRSLRALRKTRAAAPTRQQRHRIKKRCLRRTQPAPTAPTVPTVPTVSDPTPAPPPPPLPPGPAGPLQPLGGVFGPSSEFARDISAAPLATDSDALVANLASQVAGAYNGVAAFNKDQYNVSTYVVDPGQPRVDLIWDNCQNKSYTPGQLYSEQRGAVFRSVPVPDDAVPAKGTDGELSIYDPSTDQLWEFWKANLQADGWHACWGGRIDRASASKGFFADGTGVTATGLSAVAGSIGIREAQALTIDHALSLNVIRAAHWSEFSYPAQRSDGSERAGTVAAIREGQRFRLDPSVDVDALDLHPVAAAIARAAQRYGFVVNDKGGAVAVVTESGAGTVARGGKNPWSAILGGTPTYLVMKNFPWSRLQALPIDYGK